MGRNRKPRETAVISIDLGGTKLASALFTERGNVSYKRVVALEGRTGRAVAALTRMFSAAPGPVLSAAFAVAFRA